MFFLKKFLVILFCLCIVLCFAACSKTEPSKVEDIPVNQVSGREEYTPEERDEAIKRLKEHMKEMEEKKRAESNASVSQ